MTNAIASQLPTNVLIPLRIILVADSGGVTVYLPWLEHLAFERAARSEDHE